MKNEIIYSQTATWNPALPPTSSLVPDGVKDFLIKSVEIDPACFEGCWGAFGEMIWEYRGDEINAANLFKLDVRGYTSGDKPQDPITLFPPTSHCTDNTCSKFKKELLRRKDDTRTATLFTLGDGASIVNIVHLLCSACKTSYRYNYYIKSGSKQRVYYGGVPDIIQTGEHQFMERRLIDVFIGMMLHSWTSATNAARIYNTCLSRSSRRADTGDWRDSEEASEFNLRTEYVWDAFVILSLLEDIVRSGRPFLTVPHSGDQKDRFINAMQERNRSMAGGGQPEWAHACNRCCRVTQFDEKGAPTHFVRVIVTDGITIGHPCCRVPHCPTPLRSNQDRYCPWHKAQESNCCVENCDERARVGYRTCSIESHRNLEEMKAERDKGFFQLQARLSRQNVSHPNDSLNAKPEDDHVEESVEVEDSPCEEKAPRSDTNSKPTSESKLRAHFGRKRTHNEQIMVRPCGIIVARKTFFHSETTPQTIEMLKEVFPVLRSMPEIVIYDLGCQLYKHLCAQEDPLYKMVGFPVDVFHWKCKHKQNTVECSVHCNPSLFKELLNDDGSGGSRWFFNSSIAEQTNVWLGGYHAILREMTAVKFNFFLDEMILRKNLLTRMKLEKDGVAAFHLPGLT